VIPAALLTVAVIAAAIVITSQRHENSNGPQITPPTGSSGSAPAKVTIDGEDQYVQGTVACTTMGGNVNIAIGGASTGIGAVLTGANPPAVKSVGLGIVNGVTLGYTDTTGQGNASATKNGSSYKISGTATGAYMSNPMQPVNKPFEIDVTCP